MDDHEKLEQGTLAEAWPRRGTVWKKEGGESTTSLTCRRHSSFPTMACYLEIGPRLYTLLSFSLSLSLPLPSPLLSTLGVGHQIMHCILRTGAGAATWRRGRGGGTARVVRTPQSWRFDSDDAIQTPTLALMHTITCEIWGSVNGDETFSPTILGRVLPQGTSSPSRHRLKEASPPWKVIPRGAAPRARQRSSQSEVGQELFMLQIPHRVERGLVGTYLAAAGRGILRGEGGSPLVRMRAFTRVRWEV